MTGVVIAAIGVHVALIPVMAFLSMKSVQVLHVVVLDILITMDMVISTIQPSMVLAVLLSVLVQITFRNDEN